MSRDANARRPAHPRRDRAASYHFNHEPRGHAYRLFRMLKTIGMWQPTGTHADA